MFQLPATFQTGEEGDAPTDQVRSPRILADSLLAICNFKGAGMNEARSAAAATLFVAHHPYVGKRKFAHKSSYFMA